MALLAERKQKQKFGHDPLNKNWSSDDSKFGQKLMQKMGWEKGKGLGAKETGMVDHVKAVYKFDNRGLGFTPEGGDAWISHQEDFDDLLKKLNEGSTAEAQPESDRSDGRKRYYGKFARGRVATLRSTEDLDCIFGKRKNSSKPSTPSSQSAANSDDEALNASDAGGERSYGLKTVTSTSSVQEYFAEKMKALKEKRKTRNRDEEDFPGEQLSDSETQQEDKAGQTSTQQKRVPGVFGAVGFSYDDSESAKEVGLEISSGDHLNDNKEVKQAGSTEADDDERKKKKKKKNKHKDRETLESEQESRETGGNHHDEREGSSAELDVRQKKRSKSRKRSSQEVVRVEIVGKSTTEASSEEGGKKKKRKRKRMARDEADDNGNDIECLETETKKDLCEDKTKETEDSYSQADEMNSEDKRKKKKKKRKETCEEEEEENRESVTRSAKIQKEEDNSKDERNKKMVGCNLEDGVTLAEEVTTDETSKKSKGKKKKRKTSQVDDSNISQKSGSDKTLEPSSDRKRKRAKYFSQEDSDGLKNAFNGSNIIQIKGYKYNEPSKKKKKRKKGGG